MKIGILHDVVVSPNVRNAEFAPCCAYPQACVLGNGDIAVVYPAGKERHSYDHRLLMQTSSDHGVTWSEPRVLFDALGQSPARSVVTGGLGAGDDGLTLASVFTTEIPGDDRYLFGDSGVGLPRTIYAVRSDDHGRSWADPVELDTCAYKRAGFTTSPTKLANGEMLVPLNLYNEREVISVGGIRTRDGRTFTPAEAWISDPHHEINFNDAYFCVLDDGRVLAMTWAFRKSDEKTLRVHRSFSSDHGRTWSTPQDTGIVGQLAAPLKIGPNRLLAASTHRLESPGIYLWKSTDGGETWNDQAPIRFWDARHHRVSGHPATVKEADDDKGVWQAMRNFTFGVPNLLATGDGQLLLIFYATRRDTLHVRATRFCFDD